MRSITSLIVYIYIIVASSHSLAQNIGELRFNPEPYGGSLGNPLISYEAGDSLKGDLKLGGRSYPISQIAFKRQKEALAYQIPKILMTPQLILFFLNDELWLSQSFTNKTSFQISAPLKVKTSSFSEKPLSYTLAFRWPKSVNAKKIKTCFIEEQKDYTKTLCHEPQSPSQNPRLTYNGNRIDLKGSLPITENKIQVSYFVRHSSLQIETPSMLINPNFHELSVQDDNLNMTFFGARPAHSQYKEWKQRLPLSQVGDTNTFTQEDRVYYQVTTPLLAPFLNIQGPDDIVISYTLKLNSTPPEETKRLKVTPPLFRATYASTLPLKVAFTSPPKKLNNYLIQDKTFNSNEAYTWTPEVLNKYELNSPQLTLVDQETKNTFVYDFPIYKAPSLFTSLRGGFSASADGFSASTEIDLKYWFETIGFESSRQKWGLSLQTLNQTTLVSNNPIQFQMTSLDSIYRFTPGISNWDPSWAMGVGYLNYAYAGLLNQGALGASVLLTAPSPTLLSYSLGFLPFARKPKWSELQIGYYFIPLASGETTAVLTGKAMARIDISKKIYWEAGWSFESVNLRSEAKNLQLSLAAGRFLLGVGGRF